MNAANARDVARVDFGRGWRMSALDYRDFEALTFDCYGTLVDWETGLLAGVRAVLQPRGVEPSDAAILEAHARHEAAAEAGPYARYREVLARSLRGICAEHGVEPSADECARFGASVGDWLPFADTPDALRLLATRFRLGVITNCDDDLFAQTHARLGVRLDWVVTAQQVGSYKPSHRNYEAAFARIGLPRAEILHVAQSLYHDHVPANALGIASVWIDRRHDRPGPGATPSARATPRATFPSLAAFAAAATA
jgi:2-haloacid dehalogenase